MSEGGTAAVSSSPAEDADARPWRPGRVPGLVAGSIALAVYVATASRYVSCDDIAEFQTLAATGGIAHAGYPVPVMLFQLMGHLPVSTIAFRANLVTALAGALAVGLSACAAVRLGVRPVAAVVAAIALALGVTVWEMSTHAEVYAITMAIAAATFIAAQRFGERPGAGRAALLGLLGGLAVLTHFIVLGLVLPVAAVTVRAVRAGRLRVGHVAVGIVGLLIGLAPFGYMLAHDRPDAPMNYIHDTLRSDNVREPAGDDPPVTRLERAVWLLSARQYLGGYAFAPFTDLRLRSVHLITDLTLNEFPLWGLPLAAMGLWRLRRRPAWLIDLALWMAGTLFFMGVGAPLLALRVFFLPGLWILSLGIALGLDGLGRRSRVLFAAAATLLVLTPLLRMRVAEPPGPIGRYGVLSFAWAFAPAGWNPFAADRSWDVYGRGVMRALPPRALVLSCWQEATTLRYFRYAEPLRNDVDVLYHCRVPRPAFAAADAAGRPIFTTYPLTLEMTGGRPFTQVARWPRGGLWRIAGPVR